MVDEGRCDDYLRLAFDPTRVDFRELAEESFLALAVAFGAYRGHIGDQEFVQRDFEQAHALDNRESIYRFHLVNYFDTQLVSRALGTTVFELELLLKEVAHRVQLLGDGVLVSTRSQPVGLDEAEADNARIWGLLVQHGIRRSS